jgi:hypothetical protein
MLSTSYKMLSNILLPSLTPDVDEIIGYHQCGFKCVDQIQIDRIFVHSSDPGEKIREQ